MDSQAESRLIEAQRDPPWPPIESGGRRARACAGQSEDRLMAAQHELACEAAEERERACEWAAEQGMQADAEHDRQHGLEQP